MPRSRIGIVMLLAYKLSLYKGLPYILLWLLAIVSIYTYITAKTTFGRHFYALGGNEKATKLSGINTNRIYFSAYVNVSFLAALAAQNGSAVIVSGEPPKPEKNQHVLPFFAENAQGAFVVTDPKVQLPVGTLQNAIDALLRETPGAEVDYIHGASVVVELAQKHNAIGFLLPAMAKTELFPTVVFDGALPRKTFSMGEANEKRYYMECRRIRP